MRPFIKIVQIADIILRHRGWGIDVNRVSINSVTSLCCFSATSFALQDCFEGTTFRSMNCMNSLHDHRISSRWIDEAEPVEVNSFLIRSRLYVVSRKHQHGVNLEVFLIFKPTVPFYTIKVWMFNFSNMIIEIALITRSSSPPGILIDLLDHPAE